MRCRGISFFILFVLSAQLKGMDVIMKIEAPLRAFEEVQPLLDAGADIFYCGVLDNGVNNRNNNIMHQFMSFDELKKASDVIHKKGKRILLTLNAINCNYEHCIQQVEQGAADGSIDGVIVADLGLIRILNRLNPDMPVVLSCLTCINNSKSLDEYRYSNVKGFCFERNISMQNMRAIIDKNRDMKATAFISGNCNNTQMICQLHNLKTKIPLFKQEGGFGELICENWYCHNQVDESSVNAEKMNTNNWCALCALYKLRDIGVYALKIEGRGLDLPYKLHKVRYYRQALNIIDSMDFSEYESVCKELFFSEYNRKCTISDCFYPYN